jgi:hypothetical protein
MSRPFAMLGGRKMPHRVARPSYRPSVGWHITVAATLAIGVYAICLSLFLLELGQPLGYGPLELHQQTTLSTPR